MNKEQPIKGWVKGLPDDLTKMYFIRNIQTKHGGMAYVQEIEGNENIEYLDETPIQSGEERWISVEDRLPEHGQKVDLWIVPDDEEKSHRMSWTWERQDSKNIKIDGGKVTHWQPLPKPPNGEQKSNSGEERWISVENRPLFTKDKENIWTLTEDGSKEFFAAIPYNDKQQPGKELWWIRHCIIDDGGLKVVGDDDNEPAGWSLEDITHWQPLPKPPNGEQKSNVGEERLLSDKDVADYVRRLNEENMKLSAEITYVSDGYALSDLKQEIERLKGLIEYAWWLEENKESHTLQLGWQKFKTENKL